MFQELSEERARGETGSCRLLTTARWPDGLARSPVDLHLPAAAPSRALTSALRSGDIGFDAFAERYAAELRERPEVVVRLREAERRHGNVTVVSRDVTRPGAAAALLRAVEGGLLDSFPEVGHDVFATSLGECAIAWTAEGKVAALHFRDGAKVGRLVEPPEWVRDVERRATAKFAGQSVSLDDVEVEWRLIPDAIRPVLRLVRGRVRSGTTATYGEVAGWLGKPNAARHVGRCNGANPLLLVVPCHRLVGAEGKLVNYAAPGGTKTKAALLAAEGATGWVAP